MIQLDTPCFNPEETCLPEERKYSYSAPLSCLIQLSVHDSNIKAAPPFLKVSPNILKKSLSDSFRRLARIRSTGLVQKSFHFLCYETLYTTWKIQTNPITVAINLHSFLLNYMPNSLKLPKLENKDCR